MYYYIKKSIECFFNLFFAQSEKCPICFENIKQKCTTTCKHEYCTSCFVILVRQTNKCAICRKNIIDNCKSIKKQNFTQTQKDLVTELMISEAVRSSQNGIMKNVFHNLFISFFDDDNNRKERCDDFLKVVQSELFWRCLYYIIIKTCDITVYCYEKELLYLDSLS